VTNVRGDKQRTERKTVVTDLEFQEMLKTAETMQDKYMRLRAKAVLCILRLTGKRRGEVAALEFNDVKVENNFLHISFVLEKKRKRFKICPACETRNMSKALFCAKCGFNLENVAKQRKGRPTTSTKSIPLSDPLTGPIIEYMDYLKTREPSVKFLFPSARNVFGHYVILPNKHLNGRHIFNIVRGLTTNCWPHLFRETAGSEIVKNDPTLIGIFKVMQRLDLEDYRTGFNYLKRYAGDVIQREQKKVMETA
jgi:integrase